MAAPRKTTVKVLFYAIDGTGLGHVSRLLALARSARELLHALGHRADFQFLTTSDAPEVIDDFPAYKLPSKTAIAAGDAAARGFTASAKSLVANLCAGFRPDILVLDTVPDGAFHEFLFIRDYARRTAFVDRHKDRSHSRSRSHLSHLALYDLILVPAWERESGRYPLPRKLEARRRFTGPIHGLRHERLLSRAEVRARFGVPSERDVLYLSAGGGGDAHAGDEIATLLDAAADDDRWFVLVGYGPLYRGERCYRRHVVPLSEPEVYRYFAGVDAAVCAAGYNTYQELLAAGVATVFYPQKKGLDRQDERVAAGVAAGWHRAVSRLDRDLVRAELARLADPEERLRLQAGWEARPLAEGQLAGAVELLKLFADLDKSTLDRRALFPAACLRHTWTRLARASPPWAGDVSFAEAYREVAALRALARDSSVSPADDDDRYLVAWEAAQEEQPPPLPPEWRELAERGARLAGLRRATGLSFGHWRRLVADVIGDVAGDPSTFASRQRILEGLVNDLCAKVPAPERPRFLLGDDLDVADAAERLRALAADHHDHHDQPSDDEDDER